MNDLFMSFWVVLTLIVLAVAGISMLVHISLNMSRVRQMSQNIAEFNRQIEHYRGRFRILETHALNYGNSLKVRGTELLTEISQVFNELDKRCLSVKSLIEVGDSSALRSARRILGSGFIPPNVKGTNVKQSFPWQDYLQGLMNDLAREVYFASLKARSLGLSGRSRKDTLNSLRQAGINIDQFRRHDYDRVPGKDHSEEEDDGDDEGPAHTY